MPTKTANKTKMTKISKKPIVREKRVEDIASRLKGIDVKDVEKFLIERRRRIAVIRKKSSVADPKTRQKIKY